MSSSRTRQEMRHALKTRDTYFLTVKIKTYVDNYMKFHPASTKLDAIKAFVAVGKLNRRAVSYIFESDPKVYYNMDENLSFVRHTIKEYVDFTFEDQALCEKE